MPNWTLFWERHPAPCGTEPVSQEVDQKNTSHNCSNPLCSCCVAFGGVWAVSLSLPRLSACANREWFPLSIAPMPGPVNQVHKPKPLGEVLLLNSSQLLEFFFPLSLLIGESWVFPGSWFARERKKGARDYCTGGEELWRNVLWFHCISSTPLLPVHSQCAPQPKPVCATDNSALRSSKVECSICLALAQRYNNTSSDV